MTDTPLILDDQVNSRFVIEQDGATAQLVYDARRGRLVLVHTEVPDALSGRGIGGRLVRAAVERARDERLAVVPWCPFARRWLHEHPDVATGVDVDWTSRPPER